MTTLILQILLGALCLLTLGTVCFCWGGAIGFQRGINAMNSFSNRRILQQSRVRDWRGHTLN